MRQARRRDQGFRRIFIVSLLAGGARAQSDSEASPPSTTPSDTAADHAAVAPEPQFGDPGEYVISGSFNVSLGHLGYSDSPGSSFSVNLEPSVDYFVGKNVSLGAAAFISYSDNTSGFDTEAKSVAVGAYARAGGNVPLGEIVSLRPVLSLGVWHLSTTLTAPTPGYGATVGGLPISVTGQDVGETAVVVELFAPILFHPARHFFLGLGPDIYTDLANDIDDRSNKRTFVGLSSTVGGWF